MIEALDKFIYCFHAFLTLGMFYAIVRKHSTIKVIVWGCSAMALSQYLLVRRVSVLEQVVDARNCEGRE